MNFLGTTTQLNTQIVGSNPWSAFDCYLFVPLILWPISFSTVALPCKQWDWGVFLPIVNGTWRWSVGYYLKCNRSWSVLQHDHVLKLSFAVLKTLKFIQNIKNSFQIPIKMVCQWRMFSCLNNLLSIWLNYCL